MKLMDEDKKLLDELCLHHEVSRGERSCRNCLTI
jgi:hypothetical protein